MSQNTIEIYIRTNFGRNFLLYLHPNDSVDSIMEIIFEKTGQPKGQQRLVYRGKVLIPSRTLFEENVESHSRIELTPKLKGG